MTRRRLLLGLGGVLVGLAVLFVANGTSTAWRVPESGTTTARAVRATNGRVRIMAYNIAKCFAYEGLSFRSEEEVRDCVREIARVIRREAPDLVFLSEVVFEGGPVPVDQVRLLARLARMHAWAFGENYRWGLPFLRLRSGNAILSRFPLRAVKTEPLPPEGSFVNPMGNRRILWADVQLDGRWLRVGSVRNDSFDIDNNLRQARLILRRIGSRPAILAGDFNAWQGSAPMEAFRRSGRFSGELDGPPTFPADDPERCIDYVLAPRGWQLVDHRVPETRVSDHLPVVSTFVPR